MRYVSPIRYRRGRPLARLQGRRHRCGQTYRDKEAQFVSDIGKSANPNDPNLALEFAGRFAADLKNALESLPSECDCLVLIKAAVAGPHANVIDVTPALRAKVGLPSKEQR